MFISTDHAGNLTLIHALLTKKETMKFIVFFYVLALHTFLMAQYADTLNFKLKVIVTGFETNDGHAMIALCNSEHSYASKGEAYKGAIPPIENQKVQVVFDELPKGFYAVKVYHDANDNKELDTNFIGIPNEDYGFSNNARGRFGPPEWVEVNFEISADKDISIMIE